MPEIKTLLKDLLIESKDAIPAGLEISAVTDDSRRAGPETLFVAIPGTKFDGHNYLADVAARGCRVALVERKPSGIPPGIVLLRVENVRRALALIAQRLAGDPSHEMLVVGVTGTNGKTTTAYLMESIFRAAGLKAGVLGTINYRWDNHIEVDVAPQTSPSPTDLADYLGRMRRDGVMAVVMEVSSHALDQYRVDGIQFAAAALTNLTQDHLDYHHTMEQYSRAKERLFTEVVAANPNGVAVLNIDDPAGQAYLKSSRAARNFTYSLSRRGADLNCEKVLFEFKGMKLDLFHRGQPLAFYTPLLGMFNSVNCMTAISLALAAGLPHEAIAQGIRNLTGVPGRFEFIRAGQQLPIVVDYAHTPDALTQALLNARGFARRRLVVVFGCGGDRDPGKRPLMGRAAARLADQIIITNDNPRTEDPAKIADAIAAGVREESTNGKNWQIMLDRREAIRQAIRQADPRDLILIAGKGHENYQILGANKIHFDDREIAREVALEMAG